MTKLTWQSLSAVLLGAAMISFVAAGPVQADPKENEGVTTSDGGSLGLFESSGTKTTVTSGQDSPDINAVQNEAYNGPKARIAVARFTDKTGTGWYHGRIGDGMADQLATALFNSNRFIVLERQNLDAVLYEQDLGASGRVTEATAAQIGEIEGAELIITGAVTEFEGNVEGTQAGASGGGWLGGNVVTGIFGAVTGGHQKAHMAIDIRVIDARTSRIVAATSVEGEATDVNFGAALSGYSGGRFGGALSSWKKTPIGKALRITIQRAVEFIASKTPPVYYRHGQGAQVASATQGASQATQTAAVAAPAQPRAEVPSYEAMSMVRVKPKKLNMRAGPTTGHAVVVSLVQNDPLLIQSQVGDWVQVKTANSESGWVAGWLIYPDATLSADSFLKLQAEEPAAAKIATPDPEPEASVQPAAAVDSGGSKDGLRAKLKELKALYDDGLITEDEYNTMRQQTLQAF